MKYHRSRKLIVFNTKDILYFSFSFFFYIFATVCLFYLAFWLHKRFGTKYLVSIKVQSPYLNSTYQNTIIVYRSRHWRCSVKKGVLKNFRKFHRKTLVLESLFNEAAGLTPILKNICERLLLYLYSVTATYNFSS